MIRLTDISIAQLLQWADTHNTCLYLNPNDFDYPSGAFRHLLAVGVKVMITDITHTLKEIQEQNIIHKKWLFGGISYDYKNTLENLRSNHADHIGFPNLFLFEPTYVFELTHHEIFLLEGDIDGLKKQILQTMETFASHNKT